MFVAVLIMLVSTILLFFYLRAVCHKLLRRQFSREFYKVIVRDNFLEFPLVRKGVEGFGSPGEYRRLRMTLRCDFVIVTYLLKKASNLNQRFFPDDRLMMLYFEMLFVSLVTQHWLRLPENSTVLKLTAVLEYLANVVGQRINTVSFGNLTAANYLPDF